MSKFEKFTTLWKDNFKHIRTGFYIVIFSVLTWSVTSHKNTKEVLNLKNENIRLGNIIIGHQNDKGWMSEVLINQYRGRINENFAQMALGRGFDLRPALPIPQVADPTLPDSTGNGEVQE